MAENCIRRPTVEAIQAKIMAEMSKRLLGGKPVLPNTSPEIIAAIVAGAQFETGGDLSRLYDELWVDSMCCESVLKLAKSLGDNLKAATKASGPIVLSGTVGATIPSSLEIVIDNSSSSEFVLDTTKVNPSVIGSDGTATVFMIAKLPGSDSNLVVDDDATQTATLTGSVSGIDQTAVIYPSGLVGGANEETCEELRVRMRVKRKNAATSGNLAFYEDAILSYPGVVKVCFSGCQCSGCCDSSIITYYPFFNAGVYPGYGVPPIEVIKDISAYVFGDPMGSGKGKAPVGAYGEGLQAEPCMLTVMAHTRASTNPAYREAAAAAVEEFFAAIACVGSTFCTADLLQAITLAVPSACVRAVSVSGDCVTATDGTITIGCGKFPILETLSLDPGTASSPVISAA